MLSDEVQVESITQALRQGHSTRVRLYGRSMLPAVLPGAVVCIEPVEAAHCEPGDIVLVRRGPMLVAHRWVGGSPDRRILQGDNIDLPDAPIADDQVLGRVAGLVVGRSTISLPPPVRRALTRRLIALVPVLRRSSRRAHKLGRTVVRRAQRSRLLAPLRRRLQPYVIERFEPRHLPAMRTVLLEQAQRPSRRVLESWSALAHDENSVAFVARARDRIVGHASIRPDPSEARIGRCGYLWVDPWYRGLGIASALLCATVEWARASGTSRTLVATVRPGSDSLRAFSRLGFRVTEHGAEWVRLRLDVASWRT